jgi:PhoH-like ATPase
MKYFVLDTNILIHNPNSLYSFGENTVILPLTVIEELDQFKTSTDKKGAHARQALREIDAVIKHGGLKKGASLKNGGKLQIILSPPVRPDIPIDMSIEDNKILSVALDLQAKQNDVFFISKDLNARIKSEALGIPAKDYEKQTVEYAELYKGWREIAAPKSLIDELYHNGSYKPTPNGTPLLQNEYVLLNANDGSTASALGRFDSGTGTVSLLKKVPDAMGIHPLNVQQKFAFDLLFNDDIKLISLVGPAGGGKTLLAIAGALSKTIGEQSAYERLLVARPVIPFGKDIGYLPGTKDEKLSYWMKPIFDNLQYIFNLSEKKRHEQDRISLVRDSRSQDKIQYLMDSGILEVEALTYIRGRSIPHQFIIIDEAQNLTPHEVKTIISRAGQGSKIVLTGDPEQIDNPYLDANSNGLTYLVERMKNQRIVGHMLLSKSERSELASLAVELL